jgi:hypothetical protein
VLGREGQEADLTPLVGVGEDQPGSCLQGQLGICHVLLQVVSEGLGARENR